MVWRDRIETLFVSTIWDGKPMELYFRLLKILVWSSRWWSGWKHSEMHIYVNIHHIHSIHFKFVYFTFYYGKFINIYKSRESQSDYLWSCFHPSSTFVTFGLVRWLSGFTVVARQARPADLDGQIPGGRRHQLQKVVSPYTHDHGTHIHTQSMRDTSSPHALPGSE